MAKSKSPSTPFVRFLFLVYCAVMLWLLFGRSFGLVEGQSYEDLLRMNVNLIPLRTIRNYLHVVLHRTNEAMIVHCFINLAGNVLLFIPAGYLLPRIWTSLRRYIAFILTCLLIIFLVEVTQLFTLLGTFDVDDIILNLLGMTLGFAVYRLRHPKK